jgi:hypothetical protein
VKLLERPHLLSQRSRARLARAWSSARRSGALWVFVLGVLFSWLAVAALHLTGELALLVQFLVSIPPALAVLLMLDGREGTSGLRRDVRQARSALASAPIWRSQPSRRRRLAIRALCILLRVPARDFRDPE